MGLQLWYSGASEDSQDTSTTVAGAVWVSAKRRRLWRSLSSAAFLAVALMCATVTCQNHYTRIQIRNIQHCFILVKAIGTWQLLSSWMTALLSLLMSQTQINSASRWPWKKRLRIRSTTTAAERPLGTLQFSMSQKTPTGGMFSGPLFSGDPGRDTVRGPELKQTKVLFQQQMNTGALHLNNIET